MKGVPIRIEIGPQRDISNGKAIIVMARRDTGKKTISRLKSFDEHYL